MNHAFIWITALTVVGCTILHKKTDDPVQSAPPAAPEKSNVPQAQLPAKKPTASMGDTSPSSNQTPVPADDDYPVIFKSLQGKSIVFNKDLVLVGPVTNPINSDGSAANDISIGMSSGALVSQGRFAHCHIDVYKPGLPANGQTILVPSGKTFVIDGYGMSSDGTVSMLRANTASDGNDAITLSCDDSTLATTSDIQTLLGSYAKLQTQ